MKWDCFAGTCWRVSNIQPQTEMPEAMAALIRHHMLPVQPVYPFHFSRTLRFPQHFQA